MHGHWDRRLGARLLSALAAAFVFLFIGGAGARAQSDFYQATAQEIDGPPGTIIRQESMPFAPAYISAYRVLYRSRGLHGESIAVSGVVIVPKGPPPAAGRPVVAWAHPTSGVVTRCAPSRAIFIFQQIQGLRAMADAGYVVAATDYPGLGGPGVHPYLVGESEGRAVLDIVRAARAMGQADASRDFAVWGHSQGGQAALYAGLLAKTYAPELNLVGIAAAAPATELAILMKDDLGSAGGKNLTAMTLWSWQRVFGAPMSRVVEPEAIPVVNRLAEACIESIYDLVVRRDIERPLERSFLKVKNPVDIEPWRSLAAANSPGPLPSDIPLFVAQGSADQLVRPAVTRDYVNRACRAGDKVRLVILPGVGHGFAGRDSAAAAIQWIAARFAGDAPPDDCPRHKASLRPIPSVVPNGRPA
jgi:pimeloyl-ACP methyl ester carboxylesterase